MNLKEVKTCDLIDELSKREGVKRCNIRPHEKAEFDFDEDETGTMIILKIVD